MFTQPIDKEFIKYAVSTIEKVFGEHNKEIKQKDLTDNLKKIIPLFIKNISSIVKDRKAKYIGFNPKLKQNYIEFRYPGGKVNKETIKQQTLHYANIVLASKNAEFRKRDYIIKLVNFLNLGLDLYKERFKVKVDNLAVA